jgi:hypothetical protein
VDTPSADEDSRANDVASEASPVQPSERARARAPRADADLIEAVLAANAAVSSRNEASAAAALMGAPIAVHIKRLLQVGSIALALLLVVQVVHHYRSELAEIDWLRAPLGAVYGAFGMPLVPHWDVSAYEVHQLGAVAGPAIAGELTVRASIKNTAPRVQPLPLLRVTVQDRFGNRVAARDVPPAAYAAKPLALRPYLGPGQRVDAEIAFVDPGPSVVGFEIDACLADGAGRVSCANDASFAK